MAKKAKTAKAKVKVKDLKAKKDTKGAKGLVSIKRLD